MSMLLRGAPAAAALNEKTAQLVSGRAKRALSELALCALERARTISPTSGRR